MAQRVWNSAPFVGLFGDPYLRNTPYEAGGNPKALIATLEAFMDLLNPNREGEKYTLEEAISFPLTTTQLDFLTEKLLPKLQVCREWTEKGAKVQEAKNFNVFLQEWHQFLKSLKVNDSVLIPGGFIGNQSTHTILYVVEKVNEDHYTFTVCNKGPGATLYHPTKPHFETSDSQQSVCDKILVQPFIKISSIPSKRFHDMAFWAMLFSLWMKQPPSEYHRVETLYDVLLPWLAGDRLVPLAAEESESTASWKSLKLDIARTPQRSNLGFCKSLVEAIRYLCLVEGGFSEAEIKYNILFKMRYLFFTRFVRDLEYVKDPVKALPENSLDAALQVLSQVSLVDSLQGSHSISSIAPDSVIGIYFAASAHGKSRQFTNVLSSLGSNLSSKQKKFKVIVVSVDQDQAGYTKLVEALPSSFLMVPFPETDTRKKLLEIFQVRSIPTLILRDASGKILTTKGVDLVESDPSGTYFPWNPSATFALPVDSISYSERKCMEIAIKQVGLSSIKQNDRRHINAQGLLHIQELTERVDALLRDIEAASLDYEKKLQSLRQEQPNTAEFEKKIPLIGHNNMDLLSLKSQDDKYAGSSSSLDTPKLSNFLEVPERVGSITLAVAAFTRCGNLCESLLRRAADGSSSSRVALYHQVIQLITSLFVEVLPVPKPPGQEQECMWREKTPKELQLRALKHVYTHLMLLGNVWQSIEQPSRYFDSERSLASLVALSIFDALLRTPASDAPLEISTMMEQEGGYILAHSFCKANFSLQKTTCSMEFVRPNFSIVRGYVLAYFDKQSARCRNKLFEFHMPEDKIEVKKYSTTILFFRRLMETYGYQLMDPNDPNPPTEMEALMEWLLSDDTPMAKDHEEVGMTRDIVAMSKFLCTMETKEVELMRRRVGMQQWQMWQLTFDDTTHNRRNCFGSRGLNKLLNGSLKWEVSNFRGTDQDIADVEVHGFLDRKLYFGEGPVVVSPIALGPLLSTNTGSSSATRALPNIVTEDDIMHSTDLPTFSGTLSMEESEYLLSYLTVPYARIPLIAAFFSSRDRVMYLFNPILQNLIRAVLFESGDWVSNDIKEHISHIPLRKSSLLLREEAIERVFDARVQHQNCADYLGTMNGLLLNELLHAPHAVMEPLLKMLDAIKELGEASVHSADAKFILFMIKLGIDVLRYITFAADGAESSKEQKSKLEHYRRLLMDYIFGFAAMTLEKWRVEAEKANNLQTACVIHSYVTLLYISLRPTEYTPESVSNLIGSIAYVRNWHCFGMKVSAEEISATVGNDGRTSTALSAEERLLRWLQAQGINTENISKNSLDKYLKGRPLYLKVGFQTIQAPSIVALRNSEGDEQKLPPDEVLEVEIFENIHIHRRSIIKWLSGIDQACLSHVLGQIVRIALRSNDSNDSWDWQEEAGVNGAGKYNCKKTELKLDIQTGEILWRNDELKPVPDSMTQYGDFKSIFGNRSLHCGLVGRHEHRLWVNIIGSDYELIEWDDPTDDKDQGVGAPVVYKPPQSEQVGSSAPGNQMYWECPACTFANFNGDQSNPSCEVCSTPRFAPVGPANPGQSAAPVDTGFEYLGQVYSRPFDPYTEEDHPYEDENWFVQMLQGVLLSLYPPEPEDKKLQFTYFLPKEPLSSDASVVRLIGLDTGPKDKKDKEKIDTFKEIVVYRYHEVVHIFSLMSYGRRMYRKLLFSSNTRLAMHSFPLNMQPGATVTPSLKRAAGDARERQTVGGSLIVLRRNKILGGTEQYIPPRLLQGVVPSSLLENFRFWMGEDGHMRGESLDANSQWFRYRVEVNLNVDMQHGIQAKIIRKSLKSSFSLIHCTAPNSSIPERPRLNPMPPPAPSNMGFHETAPEPTYEIRDEDVVQLMALGFSYAGCCLALRENRGDVGMGAQWLLDENNQLKIIQAEQAAENEEDVVMDESTIHEQNIGLLMSLATSPSRVAIEYALEIFNKDFELAKAWLEDPGNEEEIARVEGRTSAETTSSAIKEITDVEEKVEPMEVEVIAASEEDTQALYLLNTLLITKEKSDASIYQLCQLLSKIEDMSHVLVWCHFEYPAFCNIAFIELPRLKLKLRPEISSNNYVRLHVLDQSGWFVSDLMYGTQKESFIKCLVDVAPDSLILESNTRDLRFLLPNHDVYRPTVQGEPFSTLLLSDRASVGWQQAMETRCYMYPLHSSRTFMLPPSLSATLYLILQSLLTRNYAFAMELINSCTVDIAFSPEEKWIFDQLTKTMDDRHPDACACRIRLSLCIAYSENKSPWKLSQEMHDYMMTLCHVSAVCRLTEDEEKEALTRCDQLSPLLKLRKEYHEHKGQNGTMEFKIERKRAGGQPWSKLRLYGKDYILAHGKKLSTVRYNRPKAVNMKLDDEEAVKLVWNCSVVGDEVSGSNRGLGFLFLYECLNEQIAISLGSGTPTCTRSFGDLFTRFLHLKLSRWGRETVEEGEEECSPSFALAQLAMMASTSAGVLQFSVSPTDRESTQLLSHGANLFSKQTHGTLLKSFFEFSEMEFIARLQTEDHQLQVVHPIKEQFSLLHTTSVHSFHIRPLFSQMREQTWSPSNSSCRSLKCNLSMDDLDAKLPLVNGAGLKIESLVVYCDPDTIVPDGLPFNLSGHPAAQTVAAKDLIDRLQEDIKNNSEHMNNTKHAYIGGVTPQDFAPDQMEQELPIPALEKLIVDCEEVREKDRQVVANAIAALEKNTNEVANSVETCRFKIERRAGRYPLITFDYLTALLASSSFGTDLQTRNPFVKVPTNLLIQVQHVLIRCNRIVHLNRAIQSTQALLSHLKKLNQDGQEQDNSERLGRIKQTLQSSRDLAGVLTSKRFYLRRNHIQEGWNLDPHFLIFEYVFDLLLRDRQVQMIDSFLTSLESGESRVQQMIMGAGKTTVVGPLLTFILADKAHLVTHVMPTALLEQSRQVLRSRFSNLVLRKRIFTFEFDRSAPDDAETALLLYKKLDRARRNGDVVCASPESIKSFMLKLVELLHSLEESSEIIQLPLSSTIPQSVRRLQKTLEDRSEMADELYKVLRIWQKGILIMDEVDVLLHPLRSELNFPIGNKFPIDLAANRWELPIHLLDAVLTRPDRNSVSRPNEKKELVDRLHHVLEEGYKFHTLQRFPHLVLLDMTFYETKMMPLLSEIAFLWLMKQFALGKMDVTKEQVLHYLTCSRQEIHSNVQMKQVIESGLSDSSIKLLNLARDWIRTILPHVLSKINRVSYGLLREGDLHQTTTTSPSRLLLAVPFIGKDVPSRSSEFAHPDVLIGLTILAYRYEGIRVSDLVRVVSQLKQDFSRQLGPRDQRPACTMFRGWVQLGLELSQETAGVLPLPLFQLRDHLQVSRLHGLVHQLADVVYYYVRQHVFPSCMNFQKLKVSACGHELGSNELFAKRVGFSGTPSNLLPLDLGPCFYEPRSDGNIFQVLTNPRIVSIERKLNWTAKSLLLDIAKAQDPPYHALIDTGALITGFENEQVAAFLLEHLPSQMEGVVYLDSLDRQMILLRDHHAPMPLVQCGLHPSKRFTFYDQVHTTGMDIKQCVNARAVVTLGKDMTFRDYAQGSYRMRGIETGQSIHLFMIPEVENRIRHEITLANWAGGHQLEDFLILVPAWLLINSMRMESMQLVQLSLQELHNTWRKRALHSLLDEIESAQLAKSSGLYRLRRFIGTDESKQWLRSCVEQFRVKISYAIENVVPTNRDLKQVVASLIDNNRSFMMTQEEEVRIQKVQERLHCSAVGDGNSGSFGDDDSADMRLTAEVVHENEAEAEEEAEEEAEQEEQKMSAFTRDDEHPIPWIASLLMESPKLDEKEDDTAAFYPLSRFQAHTECPAIAFPPHMLVSGNFFRRRWVGLGERRLKNIGLVLEWSPQFEQEKMKRLVAHYFKQVLATSNGALTPNEAAVKALQLAAETSTKATEEAPELASILDELSHSIPSFAVALSLAEGETIRRMIHQKHPVIQVSRIQLRTGDGDLVEAAVQSTQACQKLTIATQCLRFFNNEMYYLPKEVEFLLEGLSNVPITLRHEFFECCLRLRRRERHLWGDTPLAKVFTRQDEWHLLSARARMQQFQQSLKEKRISLVLALKRHDENNDGQLSIEELSRCFESFQLGFASTELNEIVNLIVDVQLEKQVSLEKVCMAFGISKKKMDEEINKQLAKQAALQQAEQPWNCPVCTFANAFDMKTCGVCNEMNPLLTSMTTAIEQQGWKCENCTFINQPNDVACAICEMGMDGLRSVPRGKWVCAGEQGGCTFFNPLSSFYCEVCNRARPDLASTRF